MSEVKYVPIRVSIFDKLFKDVCWLLEIGFECFEFDLLWMDEEIIPTRKCCATKQFLNSATYATELFMNKIRENSSEFFV